MERITKKFIKYFLYIILMVLIISFAGSSIFLSRFYMDEQYKELEITAKDIYSAINENSVYRNSAVKAVLIRGTSIVPIMGQGYGKMGMGGMNFFKNIDYDNLSLKGEYKHGEGENYLYYNYETELGNIIVFKNRISISEYLKIVYIILFVVLLVGIILSIPFISYLGKKFTKPIIKLQKASMQIAEGNYSFDINVNSNDEIEDLSKSLNYMADEIEKKHTLQKDFIANVSHDFKTPLSIIRNYSEAIGDGILEQDDVKEYSKEIIDEVDRLNGLVMDLLELSKFQGGKITINRDYFNLKEFLERCSLKFNSIIKDKNITMIVCCPEIQIYADSNSLSRVIYNFIQNAIKFSEDNSRIEIYVYSVNLGDKTIGEMNEENIIDKNKGDMKVCVKDNGIGIDEKMIKDIWNRYYKHSQSGGMGLGLAISSEILKLHEFQYGVESTGGNGSEFYFIIPNKYIS
jgi:signal transduction histidine kinase